MNKIIDKLGMLLLLITIVTFNLIIGANEKGLRVLPISILMAFIIVYLIIVKIKSKNKSVIFKSKIDYFVLLFMLSITLPLIFRTYASYSDTVEFIMKYFFIYSVYLLARNVIKDKKQVEIVIVITLVSSFVQVFLHIDYTHWKILEDFMKWMNITFADSKEFCGTFGYANAQAIYLALCIFLAMHRFKVNKNKVLKVIEILYIIFALYIIWIAESRAVLALIAITLFVMLIVKFRKQIATNKIKVIIGCIVLIIFTIIYVLIGLEISKSVTVENKEIKQEIKYNYKKEQKYTLELELETIYNGELEAFKDASFIIQIYERGKLFLDKKLNSAIIGEVNGTYKIEFTPTKDTDTIKVIIKSIYNGIIKVGDGYINGEKVIINYKFIPNDLGYILSGYTIYGKSLPQRLQMYTDCFKIAKDSPIVGNGGNAWKNMSRAVSEYRGALKESHSYFFELLISYGIVGLLAFLILVIYVFVKIFKQCKNNIEQCKEKLLIALGLLILIVHTLIDFDMSFMLIQLMVYVFLAVLIKDEQEIKNTKIIKYNILDFIVMLFLIFIFSLYIRADISKYVLTNNTDKQAVTSYNKKYYNYMIDDNIKNNIEGKEILSQLQDYMKKELYNTQNEDYKRYFNVIYQNIEKLSNAELKEYLDFIMERIKNVKVKSPMYSEFVITRTGIFADTIKNFEEYIARINEQDKSIETKQERIAILNKVIYELKNIINSEYESNMNNLEDHERTGYDDIVKENLKKKYQEIVNKIK